MPNNQIHLKGVLLFLGLLVVLLMIVFGSMKRMARHLERTAQKRDVPASSGQISAPYFPAPREQPVPATELKILRAREEAELNSYGWINKTAGVVRIPITRAMEILTRQEEAKP